MNELIQHPLFESTSVLQDDPKGLHEHIMSLTAKGSRLDWEYAESLFALRQRRAWKELGYDTFEEYRKSNQMRYGRSKTFDLMATYRLFIHNLALHEYPEMSDLLFSIENLDLLRVISVGIKFDMAVTKEDPIQIAKRWLTLATDIKDDDRLRLTVSEYLNSRKLPNPNISTIPKRNTIPKWRANRMPTRQQLFGEIPENAVVRIEVRLLSVGNAESEDGGDPDEQYLED